MNILILHQEELDDNLNAQLSDRRYEHLTKVLKVRTDDQLKAGILNGQLGAVKVLKVEEKFVELQFICGDTLPPPPLPCSLVLAMPRPKMLRRILQNTAALGHLL